MKKKCSRLLSVLSGAAMLLTGIPVQPVSAAAQAEPKLIALTFDDGPNTTTTNDVLDVLEEYDAKASFFLIGVNITDESAKSVKRAYDMGMEIDNHSRTHSNMGGMAPEQIQEEISYVDEQVYAITGEYPKFFRPPFIDTSDVMYDNIDLPFICGIDCQDYMENVTAQERADYILNGAKDGVIVLLHDAAGNSQTVEALKIAMPELAAQGYEFVTLTELFERQGETPKHGLLYSSVAKYPCAGYTLEEALSGDKDKITLDTAKLASLGEDYAIEVDYNGTANPPVIALQKWSGNPPIWQAIQPFYANGEKVVFLASDILPVLEQLGVTYADLDGISLTGYGTDPIELTNARLLVRGEPSDTLAGDVNADGTVSLTDLIMLQKWLHQSGKLTDAKAADLNGDNAADVFDLALLKRVLVG